MGRKMEGTRKGYRLVLFPLPLQGHINPMIQLANILHSQGFSITILHTRYNSLDPSKHPHFTFRCIHEELTGSELETSKTNWMAFLSLLNVRCVDPFRVCMSELLREAEAEEEEEPAACLISDIVFYFTQGVADGLKLPRLVLRTGGAVCTMALAASLDLAQKGYLPIQGNGDPDQPVLEFPPLKVKDLPAATTNDPETFYDIVSNMNTQAKASSGVILNTFHELEHSYLDAIGKEFDIPVFPIGPFHKHKYPESTNSASSSSLLTPDDSVISWLDKHPSKSVVYVSFGSLVSITDSELVEVAWGLANSNRPFVWVVRPGLVSEDNWAEALPDGLLEEVKRRGLLVKWAPQMEVLAHKAIGAFWTHNGWNSTLESICEGVPMICTPKVADQKVNARYVGDVWRVGLQMEDGLDRGEIERVIERIMGGKEGEEIRERIVGLGEKARLCLEPNDGSSFKSLKNLVDHILSLHLATL